MSKGRSSARFNHVATPGWYNSLPACHRQLPYISYWIVQAMDGTLVAG